MPHTPGTKRKLKQIDLQIKKHQQEIVRLRHARRRLLTTSKRSPTWAEEVLRVATEVGGPVNCATVRACLPAPMRRCVAARTYVSLCLAKLSEKGGPLRRLSRGVYVVQR